jgi:hypothetical protein
MTAVIESCRLSLALSDVSRTIVKGGDMVPLAGLSTGGVCRKSINAGPAMLLVGKEMRLRCLVNLRQWKVSGRGLDA